ncbi:acyl-CoA dehydratase activase [Pseudonocardia halophobica]|uniref:2-hydroxyglutaryl-CoA dehydratase n=1 Tax=Pseudonocardia halophobica TaxID=29401 RepID=A0A9W6NTM5_9PSEU|nr:acyl-CoA dehydratase activase [Pseudonocardia halophobica]GLL09445.1 2-hydroxyglutaryl-CoA dehydratase [Pseudonocardia halophobica]
MTGGRYLGVDLGSTTAKAVVVDGAGKILSSSVVTMGAVSRAGMQRAIDQALGEAGLTESDLQGTVSTGYGRRLVPGAGRTYTEITCHARGTAEMVPGVRLVIDVGGQDSKAITVGDDGLVRDFAMNDRCASGTGRFYEVLARAVDVPIEGLGDLALRGSDELEVSSMCATFAETEIVSMLAEDQDVADIASSVHRAIAARTLALVAQVGRYTPVVLTGGVARNPAAVHFLSRALDAEVTVPAHPQITGAFGAALLARDGDRGRPVATDVRGADEMFPRPRGHAHDGHDCSGCDGTLGPGTVDLGTVIPAWR